MKFLPRLSGLIFAFFTAAASAATMPSVEIKTDHPTAKLNLGETVTWTILRPAEAQGKLHYQLKQNNLKVLEEGDLTPEDKEKTITAKLDEPGWLYLAVTGNLPGAKNPIGSAGALVAIDQIKPVVPRPDDFAAFWKAQIEAVSKVPLNPQTKPVDAAAANTPTTAGTHAELPAAKSSKLYEVTLDNVDGKHVHAQLAVPDKPGKFPLVVLYQYAGVYPLKKEFATLWSDRGWLVLNVMAHDLPIYEPAEFYDQQNNGPLKGYTSLGNLSRDTSYFRTMLTGDYQALRYATTRPEWDGHTLVVMGTSQGGLQSFAMASLYPGVTAMVTVVPAGADPNGKQGGRQPGWPYWFSQQGDQAAILKTASYYDTINFAYDIKCPALICVGVRDTTAAPAGVTSAFNVLAGPRELAVMPDATHQGNHTPGNLRVTAWMQALRAGKPVPPAEAK